MARPGMGKTSLALNIATHVAQQSTRRRGVFVASLETRHTIIALRVNCSDACYPMSTVVRGDVTPDGWTKLTASAGAMSRLPIIIKAKTMSLQELRSYARRARSGMAEFATNGETPELGLVIVDYLQLIKPESRRGVSREQEVSAIARGLQHMANDLDVPVLALSQLSRAVEARNDKRPVMSDARDSGEIEQAADTIMAIYRDEYYNDESQDSGTAEIAVLKSKDTETGTVKVAFRKEWMKYCDLERDGGFNDYE
jgi:replicative DNA helicase